MHYFKRTGLAKKAMEFWLSLPTRPLSKKGLTFKFLILNNYGRGYAPINQSLPHLLEVFTGHLLIKSRMIRNKARTSKTYN